MKGKLVAQTLTRNLTYDRTSSAQYLYKCSGALCLSPHQVFLVFRTLGIEGGRNGETDSILPERAGASHAHWSHTTLQVDFSLKWHRIVSMCIVVQERAKQTGHRASRRNCR